MTPVLLLVAWFADAHAACDPGAGIVLNEIVPATSASPDLNTEWVELFHTGSATVELEGWVVERATQPGAWAPMFTLPAGTSLAPGAWLVVAGSSAVLPGGIDLVSLATSVELGNASSNSDAVRLVACDGSVRDVVAYGTNNSGGMFLDEELEEIADLKLAPKPGDDQSIARLPDGADTNNGASDFVRVTSPTPGASNGSQGGGGGCENAGTRGVVVINELFPNPGAGTNPAGSADGGYEWVELYNGSDATVDLSGWKLRQAGSPSAFDGNPKLIFPPGTTLAPRAHLLIAEDLIELDEGLPVLRLAEGARLSLGNSEDAIRLDDCGGTVIDTVIYGGSNPDAFDGDDDDTTPDERVGPTVAEDKSLARRADGADSDDNATDFTVADPTPGEPNTDLQCKTTAGDVVINELLPNPKGTDSTAANEFVELYNPTDDVLDLSTWTLRKVTSVGTSGPNESLIFSLPPGSMIPGKGFLVVGGVLRVEADYFAESFDLPSGTGGDMVLLYDCEGERADSLLYGGNNEDGHTEDDGSRPAAGAPKPSDNQCVARKSDGLDTNRSKDDAVATINCTPGESNAPGGSGGGDTDDPDIGGPGGGCGGRSSDGGPVIAGPREIGEGGCQTAPVPPAWLAFVLLIGLRRRR